MDPAQDQKTLNQNPPVVPMEEAPPPPAPIEPAVSAPEPAPVPPIAPASPPPKEQTTESLPPPVSPPEKKKSLPLSMFGILALLLLVVSIPAGVFLVKQQQELRSRAYEAADCNEGDRGGLKEETQDCDVNTNQLVQVFVCNNEERLPGAPTGQECPQAPQPPAGEGPSLIGAGADGPGGCCNPDAAANSAEGCRQGSGFNEICDVSNGACESGLSCRSIAGCTQDTDCGPGNECKNGKCEAVPPPQGQYASCASWEYSDDPTNEADPNCETAPQNGFSCRKPDGRAVCCYKDGNCYEGQQGGPGGQLNCENLGNGTIKLNVTTEVLEYHCTGQTSSVGSCSEGRTSLGQKGPGTYVVTGNCGGNQIDAVGYCGSYVFRGPCSVAPPGGGPAIVLQCTAVKFYDANWNFIANPAVQLRPGQSVNIAVAGTNVNSAKFKINGQERAATQKNASGELYTTVQVPSGQFTVEAQVYR